jgi:molybdopterin synthase catalytic subunit
VHVQILYFAVLRERVGTDRESLELPDGADVRGARAAIAARHPAVGALLPQVQTAVNRAIANDATVLADGDEIALLPPVSGG